MPLSPQTGETTAEHTQPAWPAPVDGGAAAAGAVLSSCVTDRGGLGAAAAAAGTVAAALHSPAAATATPAHDAWQSLEYVCPSSPHTGFDILLQMHPGLFPAAPDVGRFSTKPPGS